MLTLASQALAASTLSTVLSCPEGANDPNSPVHPHPGSLDAALVASTDYECLLFISASGDTDLTNVEITASVPNAADVVIASPAFLPGGDILIGTSDIDVPPWGTSGNVVPQPGSPTGTRFPNSYVWSFPTLTVGSSISIRFRVRAPESTYPSGPWELTVGATADNAPTPPDWVVEASRGHDPTMRIHATVTRLSVPNPVDTSATLFVRGEEEPSLGGVNSTLHTNTAFRVYPPYLDASSGLVLTDGAFDPANSDHTMLIDPLQTSLEITARSIVHGTATVTKAAGTPSAPNSGSANDGQVIRWVSAGGYFEMKVGLLSGSSGFLNRLVQTHEWVMNAPFVQSMPDGTPMSVRSCVFSDQLPAAGDCRTANYQAGPAAPPELDLYQIRHGNSLNGQLANLVDEALPLIPTDVVYSRSRFTNASSTVITNARLTHTIPGDAVGKRGDFFSACWNVGDTVSRLLGDASTANDLTIEVSTVAADFVPTSDMSMWMTPAATANWTRCDNVDGDLTCCVIDELQTLGIAAADVTEVRFSIPTAEPSSSVIPLLTWEVSDGPVDSIDGVTDLFGTSLDNMSFGARATLDWTGNTSGTQYAYHTAEATENRCEVSVTPFCPLRRSPDVGCTDSVTHAIGEKHDWWVTLWNLGLEGNVEGELSFCGSAPVGWEFDGTVIATGIDASLVNVTYDVASRELCASIAAADLPTIGNAHGIDRFNGSGSILAFDIRLFGDVVPGPATLQMPRTSYDLTLCDEPTSLGAAATTQVVNVVGEPAPALIVTPDHGLIGQQATITYDLSLDNNAYLEDGSGRDPNGAGVPAADVAVFQKVPKSGDYPTCAQGNVSTTFASASADGTDASAIWVATSPSITSGPASTSVTVANGWTLCAAPPAVCDAAALAAIGMTPASVEWVSWVVGDVAVTDAEPRGVAPLRGATRVNNTYDFTFVVTEQGTSDDEAFVCSEAKFAGTNFLPAGVNPEEIAVEIEYDCELGGFGDVEVCDGEVDEGFPGVGDPCSYGTGMCERDSITVCTADGMGLECYEPPPCDDGDPCNGEETCDPATGCVAGTPVDCDDNNGCTADSCFEFAYEATCSNVAVADGTSCADDSVCNGDETCLDGQCDAGTPLSCDDGDACNGLESCDPVAGCEDGTAIDCDDNDPCTADSCDAGDGSCSNAPVGGCQFCGNGNTEGTEECDDAGANSDTAVDACRSDCTAASCGDGVIDTDETCDDGPSNNDAMANACRTDCTPAECGDGVIDLGETCDDGSGNSDGTPDACRTDCSEASCGDSVIDDGEACDDGGANSDTADGACRTDCTEARCGDGNLDAGLGEACDDGLDNSDTEPGACRTDCTEAMCGDGVVDGDEDCDDGAGNSDTDPNACRTNCTEPSCGDGVLDTDEDCDDGAGNGNTPDACRSDCSAPTCGDSIIDSGEQCDDGAANSSTTADACRNDCTDPVCGDGVIDSGESCDNGGANDDGTADACRVDCTEARCGDGTIDSGETCDDGPANDDVTPDACRTTCVAPSCGDSVVDAGETCDDGNDDSTDDCVGCAAAVCGDGVIQAGVEVCDDGALNSDSAPNACRSDCTPPECGDGVADAGEACDDGDDNGQANACNASCSGTTGSVCGNGELEDGETCDDGADNSDTVADACRMSCVPASCGDGVVDAADTCDDGVNNSDVAPNACRSDCVPASCGDGVIDDGEACDAGAANSDTAADACRASCVVATCGDGVIDSDETCDNGGANSDVDVDACRTTCEPASCGDGVVDAGETCDDGDANGDPNACDASCGGTTVAICGNGVIEAGETCDAGADNSDTFADACRTSCVPASCGDGVVDADEGCDMGAANSDTVADSCRTTCQPASCGDGVVDPGADEACDDGVANSDVAADACRTSCVQPSCGDGVVDTAGLEECDNGMSNSDSVSDACRTSCMQPSCGDGVVDTGETCDDGDANGLPNGCNLMCSGTVSATCGNGAVEDGEDCDDGPANSDAAADACRTDCSMPSCDDGVIDTGEVCDDAGDNGMPNQCNDDCTGTTTPECGNGAVEAGEVCDSGDDNGDAPDACRGTCMPATCGDGIVDTGESCDDGSENGTANSCLADCSGMTESMCGNGIVEADEDCDDGDDNGDAPDACRADCRAAGCGDGIVDTGELCDAGSANGTAGACDVGCQVEGPIDAQDDWYWTAMNASFAAAAPGALANDTWQGGLTATAGLVDAAADTTGSSMSLASDGGFDFTPATDLTGQVDYPYATTDSAGNMADAVIHITINDPPTPVMLERTMVQGATDAISIDDLAADLGAVDGTDADDGDSNGLAEGALTVSDAEDGEYGDSAELGVGSSCAVDATGFVSITVGADAGAGTTTCYVQVCEELPAAAPRACSVSEVSVTVLATSCGNGVVDDGEDCDDGNLDNTDACPDDVMAGGSCRDAFCGDGFIWAGQDECDDGETSPSAGGCKADCSGFVAPDCGAAGDGVAGAETCDGLDTDCDGFVDATYDVSTDEVTPVCAECDVDNADLDCDGDGVDNGVDACPGVASTDQNDCDGDGFGDACDPEGDFAGAGACVGEAVIVSGGACSGGDSSPLWPMVWLAGLALIAARRQRA